MEFHIIDATTGGDEQHIRQYDNEADWLIEVIDNPRAARKLEENGAERVTNKRAESLLYRADTPQLISYLAQIAGYHVKLRKKQKRQYSEATKVAMRERLQKINAMRNAILSEDSTPESTF